MDHPGITAFMAIVRTQSLSKAAAQLNLAQSTVSKRLRSLELELGIKLIERGRGQKATQLTPSGEEFVELAERWEALWRETLILRTKGPRMSLSIAVVDSMLNSVFPSIYSKLRELRQDIRLRITTTHSTEAYDSVERRDIDMAFSLLELSYSNVAVEKCYSEPLVVLRIDPGDAPIPAHVHPRDLDPDRELYIRWEARHQIWHDHWWDPLAPGRTTLDTGQLILKCLRIPDEWAIVPLTLAKRAQAKGRYAIQYLSESPPERTVYKLTHRLPKAGAANSLHLLNQCMEAALAEYKGLVTR